MNDDNTPRSLLRPGDRLNNTYVITRMLGRGGMGEVYVGHSLALGEDVVAIKVILPGNAADENFQKLFGREARALLKVRHPAIVGYRSFSHDPALGLHYIVTDFVEGENLAQRLKQGPIAGEDFRALARGLIRGLMAVHEAGIVHRDLAPDNVILEDNDVARPRIIDFGVVKDTSGSLTTIIGDNIVGKLNFMAPEQLGKPRYEIGPWTDAYSLGLVLLAALRGKPVDMGGSFADAIDKRQTPLDLADIAPVWRRVLEPMLAPHPAERVQSMAEVLGLLDTASERPRAPQGDAEALTIMAAPSPAGGDPKPEDAIRAPPRRPRRWMMAGSAAGALAAAGLALVLAQANGVVDWVGGAPGDLPPPGADAANPSPAAEAVQPDGAADVLAQATPAPTPTPDIAAEAEEKVKAAVTDVDAALAAAEDAVSGNSASTCLSGPYIVFFEFDRSQITPEAEPILRAAANQFARCGPGTRVRLAGHTDRRNSASYNVRLSQRMTDSVAFYLAGLGIPPDRIASQSFGESRPRVPTADGVAEAQNRRVEITFGP